MSVLQKLSIYVHDTVTVYKERQCFQDLLRYIRKTALTENHHQITRELNKYMDQIIAEINEQFKGKHLDSVRIESFDDEFTQKILLISVHGSVHAENGWYKSLSTIYRYKNCKLLIPRPDTRIFTFSLALKTAELGFEKFDFRWGIIHGKGTVSVKPRQNCVDVQVTMGLKKTNKLERMTVDSVRLTKCGKYDINITGFGKFGGNSCAKMVVKIMLSKYDRELRRNFEADFRKYLENLIESLL